MVGGSIQFLNGYTRNSARLNANQTIGSMWQGGVNTFFARGEEERSSVRDALARWMAAHPEGSLEERETERVPVDLKVTCQTRDGSFIASTSSG